MNSTARRLHFEKRDEMRADTLGVPGEYGARVAIGDDQVGQPSDIVRVTFGG